MKKRLKERKHGATPADAPPGIAPQARFRRETVLLAACVLLLCGIFLGKAYNIDDPLTVWTAQRIAEHPADFYGFDVNWYGTLAPMHEIDLNPPGAAYYLAPFGILFNWHEAALHIAMAFASVAMILGVYYLARLMNGRPLTAAVFALVSPGIFVSMGTVMTDVPMTALWVWAIALWLRGLNDERPGYNAASGVLIGAAVLVKYFAFSLVPLLFVCTLFSGRRRRLVWLLIPVAALGLFELYMWRLYGTGHIWMIAGMAEKYHAETTYNYGRKILTGLTFLGAGAAPALFLAPLLWRKRKIFWAGAAAAALVTAILKLTGWQPGETQIVFGWGFWIQYGLWLLAGVNIVALAVAELRRVRDRDGDAVLLALWLGGTFFYYVFIHHLVNIRTILPALPVVALLCARRLNRLQPGVGRKAGRSAIRQAAGENAVFNAAVWPALAASLALSLCVAWADISLANSARTAAGIIAPEKRDGRTWFSGHWGFQYYMEARGAKAIDVNRRDFQLGDTAVTPLNAANTFLSRPRVTSVDQSFELPVLGWITTMRTECGAGFHADIWGPLPFVFGPVPNERYQVILLGEQ